MRRLKLNPDDTVSLFCNYEDRQICKSFKDYRWNNRAKCWEYPFDIKKIDDMKKTWTELEIDSSILEKIEKWKNKSAKLEDIKKCKDVSLNDINYKFKTTPYNHQKVGFKWLIEAGNGLILDEMGAGKSAQALYYGEYLIQQGKIERIVIFCPKSIKWNWGNEVLKHTELTPVIIEGTKAKREKEIKKVGHIYIINYMGAVIFNEEIRKLVENQMLIIDEIHFVKNPKTKISKLTFTLNPKYKIGMTGTPAHNGLQDVYNPIQFIKKYWRNSWNFRDKYCVMGGFQKHEIVKFRNVEDLKCKLESVSIRRLTNEILDLPEYTYQTRLLEMEGEQLKAYKKMREEMILMWKDKSEEELTLMYAQVNAQLVRLSQIADGYLSDGIRQEWIKGNIKERELDLILEEVIDGEKKKCVVWSQYVYPVLQLWNKYKDKYGAVHMYGKTNERDRKEAVKRLNEDLETKLFIAQMSTGGIGLNLTGARVQVAYKLNYNENNNEQAYRRLIRISQTGTVSIIKLITKDTIDEKIRKITKKKARESAGLHSEMGKLDKARLMEILS